MVAKFTVDAEIFEADFLDFTYLFTLLMCTTAIVVHKTQNHGCIQLTGRNPLWLLLLPFSFSDMRFVGVLIYCLLQVGKG